MTNSSGNTRLAVVTGGGRGIGRAITLRLVKSGWRCLVAGLDEDDLDETRGRAVTPEAVTTHACDLATEESRTSLTQRAEEQHADLGLLVNCTARSIGIPLFAQPTQTWQRELETNLVAVSILSSWAIKQMRPTGGVIINIAAAHSSGRAEGLPLARHAASGGIRALTRELAVAAGKWNIRVNTIAPRMIKEGTGELSPETAALIGDPTPLGRFGTPDDVAAVVEFLASEDASFVTGAHWVVDGGRSLQ